MLRRSFLRSALAAAAVPARRPNFLFLIADDLTHRAVGTVNPEVRTPNLDRLARRGVAFTHCFHQGSWQPAVCVASRGMLNTGLTAFRAQRRVEEAPLWGETLGAAGYNTAIVGKWHLSAANLKRSFREQGPVSGGMFESGPEAYDRPKPGNDWTPWDKSLKGQWLRTDEWQKSRPGEILHSAGIWADEAANHISKQTGKADPFFLYVGFNSPHDPRQAPKEFVDRYPPDRVAVPPNFQAEHPFDQGDHKVRDELLAPFPRSREAVRVHRGEYYAHIEYMDAQIGRILDALEKSGQAGNTYVIFTADHGLAVGEHGLMGKQNMYDHSIRVPLTIAGPGLRAGRRVNEMVYQHSVFATTCDLAGVRAPGTVEFPSLAGLLHGGGAPLHDAVFSFYRGFQRMVRTPEHKLIVYPAAGRTQLFNVRRDHWETRDLSDKRGSRALRRDLEARLRRFQAELEDDLPRAR